ncbi:hypothetical protein, partial [Aphanothece microscopica]|uniref:hypothetical protein n=1 Tax=Aphanothece microscopica TaxID=1049561 RepID=UPI003984D291
MASVLAIALSAMSGCASQGQRNGEYSTDVSELEPLEGKYGFENPDVYQLILPLDALAPSEAEVAAIDHAPQEAISAYMARLGFDYEPLPASEPRFSAMTRRYGIGSMSDAQNMGYARPPETDAARAADVRRSALRANLSEAAGEALYGSEPDGQGCLDVGFEETF